MRWLEEGDKNTKFFRSFVKGGRKMLHLTQIINNQREIIQTNQEIGEEAIAIGSNLKRKA